MGATREADAAGQEGKKWISWLFGSTASKRTKESAEGISVRLAVLLGFSRWPEESSSKT